MNKICLIAVDIRSSYNIGSLFRSCDGFGAELALVGISPQPIHNNDSRLPHLAAKTDSAIAKTALGAEKTVRWCYFETLEICCEALRKDGFKIFAIEQSVSSKDISELEIEVDTALVLGREVEGLTSQELAMCDEVYEITMKGQKESFNVAVTAGIALYQTTRTTTN
jgi:23S rRNA (guanosine2251-2'-O)-methyltransferase